MGKSFLSWLGGKSQLTREIIPLIPEHHCYCEVFAGAAWLLFRKEPSRVEVINDINVELVTLYRCVQHHLEEFVKQFKWILTARDEFQRFIKSDPDSLTDIQRAARFYYLVRSGYGSRINNPSFSVSTTRSSNFNLLRIEEDLSAAHLRLARVYVENQNYAKLITKHDRLDTFFYIDPPYYGCEDYYGKNVFDPADFERLRDLLLGVKGKFILSINDAQPIRDLFSQFDLHEVSVNYSVGTSRKRSPELLITNY
jgi:DNA adenine methylase